MAEERAAQRRRGFGPARPAGHLRSARPARLLTVVSVILTAALATATSASAAGGVDLGVTPSHHAQSNPRATNPLHGRAMWIWELPVTDDGDVARIIAGARYYRITTLIIKSSDGTDAWPQFTPALVSALHSAHLKVCAWQYVYGNRPGVEANLGADAVKDGADCLIIDAENEYEGRYVAAQAYVHDLRKQIGHRYPVALAGFPYVDFHPAFPYSVFLGPGGAQYNVPQMYWRDIGASPAVVFAHTYAFNLPYHRPIFPLGQVYGNPPARQIEQFRQLALQYGAGGVSWWDWQEARAPDWTALSAATTPLPHAATATETTMATVGLPARGDHVVWIQEHLVSAGEPDMIDGRFGPSTVAAVEAFQTAHGLLADGIVGPETWAALLRYQPAPVTWVRHGSRTVTADTESIGRAVRVAGGGAPLTLQVPASAAERSRRDEIPGRLGAGGRFSFRRSGARGRRRRARRA
jgi:hypothetical protein